jgi:hypothetical protein
MWTETFVTYFKILIRSSSCSGLKRISKNVKPWPPDFDMREVISTPQCSVPHPDPTSFSPHGIFLKSLLISSSNVCLSVSKGLLQCDCSANGLRALLLSPNGHTRYIRTDLLDFIFLIISDEEKQGWNRHVLPDISVSRAFRLEAEWSRGRVRFPVGARDFSLIHHVQNGPGANPASYTLSSEGVPWDWSGRDVKLTTHLHLVRR